MGKPVLIVPLDQEVPGALARLRLEPLCDHRNSGPERMQEFADERDAARVAPAAHLLQELHGVQDTRGAPLS